jgi:hypothetical protein
MEETVPILQALPTSPPNIHNFILFMHNFGPLRPTYVSLMTEHTLRPHPKKHSKK